MDDPSAQPRVEDPGPDHVEALAALIPDARRRDDVVAVLLDAAENPLAAALVDVADVELVGGERFAIFETVPAKLPGEQADALLSGTYRLLDEAFDPDDTDGPIGLCLLVADRGEMRRRPAAFWPDPPTHYVGFLGDGRLVRVAYFTDAALRGPA